MDKKEIIFIGVFPPPYGGVTVKDKLLQDTLKQYNKCDVKVIDVLEAKRKKWSIPSIVLKSILAFISGKVIVYGLDSKRLKGYLRIHRFFRNSLSRSTIVTMGGQFHQTVNSSKILKQTLTQVKEIWVETEGMKQQMVKMGFDNIEVFPNPKTSTGSCKPRKSSCLEPIRLVYFSQISQEKGIQDIFDLVDLLETSKKIPYKLELYGHIVPEIKNEFESFLKKSSNISYHGIFDSTKGNLYRKLNEYDLLLFPSHWMAEGVPGVLVEIKMSGLSVIASNLSYNTEIIRESQKEGIIIKENYPEEMYQAIQRCCENRTLLMELKEGSYKSRYRYSLEKYDVLSRRITDL